MDQFVYIHSRQAENPIDQVPYYVGVGTKRTARLIKYKNKSWMQHYREHGKLLEYANADPLTKQEAAVLAFKLITEYRNKGYDLANAEGTSVADFTMDRTSTPVVFEHEDGTRESCTATELMRKYGLSRRVYGLTSRSVEKYRGWRVVD